VQLHLDNAVVVISAVHNGTYILIAKYNPAC